MTQDHPPTERYVSRLEAALAGLDAAERAEIVQEIRNHVAEACAAGRPADAVLAALGPADVLARAYALELALNAPDDRRLAGFGRLLAVIALVAAGGFVTFFVVSMLFLAGVGFGAGGLAMMAIGVLEGAGIHLPGVQMNGVAPVWAVLLGAATLAVGALSFLGLYAYVRVLIRALRRVLPRRSPSASGRGFADDK